MPPSVAVSGLPRHRAGAPRQLRGLVALSGLAVLPLLGFPSGAPAQESAAEADLLAVDSAEVAARLAGGESWKTDFSRVTVQPGEFVSGGPGKDEIPVLDEPGFVSAGEADAWLEAKDPVMVVEVDGEVKGYPLQILTYHEIVNDVVGGKPVAATFCPLCNTALVFDREVGGRTLSFATTGRLRRSDLVMFDRETESWWQQATGEAVVGEYAGTRLDFLPVNILGWERAKSLHPEVRVLSRKTGYGQYYDYERNPYAGYDDPEGGPNPRFFSGPRDDRLPPMERVVALDLGEGWAAPYGDLRETRVVNDSVAGRPIAVFWASGVASPLDREDVSRGREIGQTAVFDRRAGGRTLSFRWEGGEFRDAETGSVWNLAGEAVEGELRGRRLTPVVHDNPFWFAWAAFYPETEVWRAAN